MQFETDRLILREMMETDFESLYDILSDQETMKYYPRPFDADKVRNWIKWNQNNYAEYGFGLWAVILKETGLLIGDCGITMQNIHGRILPEIGYHIHKLYTNKGYATEAAAKCMQFFFENTSFGQVYSYMRYTNKPSARVALKNGMKLFETYSDPVNTVVNVYAITKCEWEARLSHFSIL